MGLRVTDASGERFFEGLAGTEKRCELVLTNAQGGPPKVEVEIGPYGISIRWHYAQAPEAANHAELRLSEQPPGC